MSEDDVKQNLELDVMQQEINRLKAENVKLLTAALEKAKAENAKLLAAAEKAKAENTKLMANSRKHRPRRGAHREREFELDLTRYYDKPKKLDPNGHDLAWVAHELMGDYDEQFFQRFIQEGDTMDGDEEYQTPEDDG
jgi:hypothetical protein